MKKLYIFLFAIMFLWLFNCSIKLVSASDIEYFGIENRIKEDLSISTSIDITYNQKIENFQYVIRNKVDNVEITSEFAPIECETKIKDITIINCTFKDFEKYNVSKVKIKYTTGESVKRIEGVYEATLFIPVDENINRLFHIIYLPPSGTLVSQNTSVSGSEQPGFLPRDGKILSDGRHIMVYWERTSLKKGEDLYFTIKYKMPKEEIDYTNLIITSIIAFLIIFALGIFYLKFTKKEDAMKIVMPLLKGDEKIVVDIITRHGGVVNQKVIVRESDFSKAKVSRILAGLKERGILDIEPMGRTNKITLKIEQMTKKSSASKSSSQQNPS